MKQLSWLKTKVGLFQDPRIMYLLSQPNGDTYFVLWFFLKDLAGSLNDNGLVYVSASEPMTTALIAKAIHRRKAFVEKALDVLERIDLIQRDETGIMQLLVAQIAFTGTLTANGRPERSVIMPREVETC